MASTGDLRNNIAKLQTELKYLRYAGPFEVSRFPHVSDHCLAACLSRPRILVTFGHTLNSLLFEQYSLSRGDPAAFLPLMHFIFLESDPALAAHFAHLNHSLTAKRDSRFVESVWKLLRDVFDFKPVLSKEQFLSDGFAEHKMLLLTEIAHLCKKMGVDLARRKDRKSTRSVPESTQAQPKAGLSASSITPRLPINASWNQQTSVNTISNTDTIKNNSHQGHQVPASKSRTAAVPRVPQQALDPTIYSSFDILDGLNQSYPASVHLNQFHASLNAKKIESDALQRQIRMLEDLPYSALNGTDRRFLRQRSSGSAMQTEINGIDAWGQFGELMPSGVIADPDFSALYTDAPSHVLPNTDISASMLHEPHTAPPPPAAYPQRQPQQRRSILKPSRAAEDQSATRDNPLKLQDLKSSHHRQTSSTAADGVPVKEVMSPIGGESRLLTSTSATSGSRSLNRADTSSSGATAAPAVAAPVTRIEAARNRWNSAGLVLPAGYKGNGSNGSAAVGSVKSGNGGVGEWAGGASLSGGRAKREISQDEGRQDGRESNDIHHLEGLVSNLMGVVTKLWESNESMNEHISILSERLARVELKTDAVMDRLGLPSSAGVCITSSSQENENALSSSTYVLRESFKQYCSPQPAFHENTLPKNCNTGASFSLTHYDRESVLTCGALDDSCVPPTSVQLPAPFMAPSVVEIGSDLQATVTRPSPGAISISQGRGAFSISVKQAPTGEYIRNIEERLKATSALLLQAKMGQLHRQSTTSA